MTTDPTAVLRDAETYLSALHNHVARHDQLGADFTCHGCQLREQITAVLAAAPTPPADQNLRDRIAQALREHYLCTNRDEADADGNLPCRCGDWREPGAEEDGENDWDTHLADAVLPVLPARDGLDAALLALAEDKHHTERVHADNARLRSQLEALREMLRQTRTTVLREAADGFDRHAAHLLSDANDKAEFVGKALMREAATWREAAETLRRMADEAQQAVVAYRRDADGSLCCTDCRHLKGSYTPLTADDLPDGGICPCCHTDVLIEQAGEGR